MSVEFATIVRTIGEDVSPGDIERTTGLAERHGFDALLAGDHIALPVESSNTYPWTPSGEPPEMYAATADYYGPFEVLAYVAGMTDRVAIGTNVCIAPLRHPVTLTKTALTLDVLSGGRFELGVSVGWLREEYEVLDVPFDERGSRTDEFLEVFELACENEQFAFDGPHHTFQETGFNPRPTASGGPTIWIGGTSSAALRRLGRYGDGIVTVWDSPNEVRELLERMYRAWNDHDRDGNPELAVIRPAGVDPKAGSSRPLIGSADEVLADVTRYAEAGATRLVLDFLTEDVSEKHRQLELFGTDVFPHL